MRPAIRYLFRNKSAVGTRAARLVLGHGEDVPVRILEPCDLGRGTLCRSGWAGLRVRLRRDATKPPTLQFELGPGGMSMRRGGEKVHTNRQPDRRDDTSKEIFGNPPTHTFPRQRAH